ncbi:UNVERIFIED_CONTAM: hypothetical protein GTU68_023564 [Idotea baltica]|nr:hypothetical protein [Idotea baltica]MCL4117882.1 hypothetical protein [Idotea baltica]
MTTLKENLNGTSLLIQPHLRKNSGAASATMRKYQQLALALVSVISLMAFLFYKHEYDRLRYTLEYLEMFGSSPSDVGANPICGSSKYRRVYTTPSMWTILSSDIVVYSSFWDEGNGLANPFIRTITLVKKSDKPPDELQCKILFEMNLKDVNAVCSLEHVKLRNHAQFSTEDSNIQIANLICKPEDKERNVPYLTQFKIGNQDWAPPVLIQESESWKSVANITCACVFSSTVPVSSLRLVEFISHHSILGVEKFVFFGTILTPLVRKLLDKYGEESNIFYEEKSFTLPSGFSLNDEERRTIIERDCLYRHRDTHENILVLKMSEFLVPRSYNSLQEVLLSAGSGDSASVAEFHFVSQRVCLDQTHTKQTDLLLDSQIRSFSENKNVGAAVLRPHLFNSGLTSNFRRVAAVPYAQHIPSAVANIYVFEPCTGGETHSEKDHLPTYARFASLIQKSLLYRKWSLNS